MEILSGDFGSMGRLAISLNGLKHIKLNLLIVIALSLHTQDKYVTYYNNNKSNTMSWKWKKVHTTLWQIVSFFLSNCPFLAFFFVYVRKMISRIFGSFLAVFYSTIMKCMNNTIPFKYKFVNCWLNWHQWSIGLCTRRFQVRVWQRGLALHRRLAFAGNITTAN